MKFSKVSGTWRFAFERFRYKPSPVSPPGLLEVCFCNVTVKATSRPQFLFRSDFHPGDLLKEGDDGGMIRLALSLFHQGNEDLLDKT
jgi:hypothetical protein